MDQTNIHPLNASLFAEFATTDQLESSYNAQSSIATGEGRQTQWMSADYDLGSMMDFSLEAYPDVFEQEDIFATNLQDLVVPQMPHFGAGESGPLHNDGRASITENTATIDANTVPNITPSNLPDPTVSEGGFTMSQLDPTEAKCLEIRALLAGSWTSKDEDALAYINRSNLVLCVGLYGKRFQPNLPIIHLPTFTLIETSPTLLLALMLVGACCSESSVPRAIIDKLAMRLLFSIGSQAVSLLMTESSTLTKLSTVSMKPKWKFLRYPRYRQAAYWVTYLSLLRPTQSSRRRKSVLRVIFP